MKRYQKEFIASFLIWMIIAIIIDQKILMALAYLSFMFMFNSVIRYVTETKEEHDTRYDELFKEWTDEKIDMFIRLDMEIHVDQFSTDGKAYKHELIISLTDPDIGYNDFIILARKKLNNTIAEHERNN